VCSTSALLGPRSSRGKSNSRHLVRFRFHFHICRSLLWLVSSSKPIKCTWLVANNDIPQSAVDIGRYWRSSFGAIHNGVLLCLQKTRCLPTHSEQQRLDLSMLEIESSTNDPRVGPYSSTKRLQTRKQRGVMRHIPEEEQISCP
jgi:hypothetical protein